MKTIKQLEEKIAKQEKRFDNASLLFAILMLFMTFAFGLLAIVNSNQENTNNELFSLITEHIISLNANQNTIYNKEIDNSQSIERLEKILNSNTTIPSVQYP